MTASVSLGDKGLKQVYLVIKAEGLTGAQPPLVGAPCGELYAGQVTVTRDRGASAKTKENTKENTKGTTQQQEL